jgi:hypothetical protein
LPPEGETTASPTSALHPDEPPHPDGPEEPCYFWWKGTCYDDLQAIPCRLLIHLWGRDKVPIDDQLGQFVWGREDSWESRLSSALNRVNEFLDQAGVPWSYGKKKGFVVVKK